MHVIVINVFLKTFQWVIQVIQVPLTPLANKGNQPVWKNQVLVITTLLCVKPSSNLDVNKVSDLFGGLYV